jgi:hypothetical protein
MLIVFLEVLNSHHKTSKKAEQHEGEFVQTVIKISAADQSCVTSSIKIIVNMIL